MRIAVELDPPERNAGGDTLCFLRDGALALRKAGADCITMADNPRAISRGDSVSLAILVNALTGVPVLPHLACRDRNELSLRSALSALDMAGLHEVLIVTGDPVREEDRSRIRGRAGVCAAELACLIPEWASEGFSREVSVSAALNVNAHNFDAELSRARRKEANGVSRFFTQPILSPEGLANLALARISLECAIFGGILPVVSSRNADFLSTGIRGIRIDDGIRARYRGIDRDEASSLAVSLSLEFAHEMRGFVDGYYLITPFRRLDIIEKILEGIRSEEGGETDVAGVSAEGAQAKEIADGGTKHARAS